MINIFSVRKVIKQIINLPDMQIVADASSLLETAIRKINEGRKFISGEQQYYWVLIYYMLSDKYFVRITPQKKSDFF